MALGDLDDPQAVIAAVDEAKEIGRVPFLKKYGFGKALRYMLRHNGELYDSKAIAAAAHGYQFGQPLQQDELSGGVDHAAGRLRAMGFDIVDIRAAGELEPAIEPSELVEGRAYSWQELVVHPSSSLGDVGILPFASKFLSICSTGWSVPNGCHQADRGVGRGPGGA